MTPMLQRMVRAMQESSAWSSFWSGDDAEVLIRAALAKLREPDKPMMEAMIRRRGLDPGALVADMLDVMTVDTLHGSLADHRAMIDAVLADGEQP